MEPYSIIVGLGRSGISAANLLNSEGKKVIVLEKQQGNSFKFLSEKLLRKGINVQLGKGLEIESFEPWLNQIERVVISPGIAWNHPTLEKLRTLGIKVQGEIGLAWSRLKDLPWIGVTGTNGKTTVTILLNHILESNGLIAPMGGNVGNAATGLALLKNHLRQKKPDWLIIEMSSYQIETAPEILPKIGIWTNITPDHLERHGTFDQYKKIKRSLIEKSEVQIFNADDKELISQRSNFSNGIWISAEGPGQVNHPFDLWIDKKGIVIKKGEKLFHSSALDMPGKHNLQNLLIATAAAIEVGIEPKAIEKSLKTFPGIPHRLERLGFINGIPVFNDSKATNYQASSIGIKAVPSPSILLAGGQAKTGDSTDWLQEIEASTYGVVLFGQSRWELETLIENTSFQWEKRLCETLNESVQAAIELCFKSNAKSILFSPACASFDQYQNYESRGNHFRELIKPFLDQ